MVAFWNVFYLNLWAWDFLVISHSSTKYSDPARLFKVRSDPQNIATVGEEHVYTPPPKSHLPTAETAGTIPTKDSFPLSVLGMEREN